MCINIYFNGSSNMQCRSVQRPYLVNQEIETNLYLQLSKSFDKH